MENLGAWRILDDCFMDCNCDIIQVPRIQSTHVDATRLEHVNVMSATKEVNLASWNETWINSWTIKAHRMPYAGMWSEGIFLRIRKEVQRTIESSIGEHPNLSNNVTPISRCPQCHQSLIQSFSHQSNPIRHGSDASFPFFENVWIVQCWKDK